MGEQLTHVYSDPHFNHHNMACVFTLDDGSKARPFTDASHMNQTLLNRYRALVQPEDTVWWLGDVVFKPHAALIEAIASLPGTRYLILGNHDRESATLYARMGFTKLRSSWQTEGMLFTHIPVHQGQLRVRRGAQMVNVHGHTHTNEVQGPYVNVCVEKTAYQPLAWPVLMQRVEAKRAAMGA